MSEIKLDEYLQKLEGTQKIWMLKIPMMLDPILYNIKPTVEKDAVIYQKGKYFLAFTPMKTQIIVQTSEADLYELMEALQPAIKLTEKGAKLSYKEEYNLDVIAKIAKELMFRIEAEKPDETDIVGMMKWNKIPAEIRQLYTQSVYCSKCKNTEIVDFIVQNNNGDLILKGFCKTCGGKVARVID